MRAESLGTLPGEISPMRVGEKSADAVVARKRLKERGAKGGRTRETDPFDHLRSLANSLLKRPDVATAAAIRARETRAGRWIPVSGDFRKGESGCGRRRKENGAE